MLYFCPVPVVYSPVYFSKTTTIPTFCQLMFIYFPRHKRWCIYPVMHRALPLLFCLLTSVNILHSQSEIDYKIRQISLPDVHSNRNITDICQDRSGTLWIGSSSGLFIYDGNQALPYPPVSRENLPDAWVNSLAEDDQGYLWIGTAKGLILLSPQRDKLQSPSFIGLPDSLSQREDFHFCEGAANELFILTNRDVFVYAKGTLTHWRTLPKQIERSKRLQLSYSPRSRHLYVYNPDIRDFFLCGQTGPTLRDFIFTEEKKRWTAPKPANLMLSLSRAFSDSVSLFFISGESLAEHSFYLKVDEKKCTITYDQSQPIENTIPILQKVRHYIQQNGGPNKVFDGLIYFQIYQLRNGLYAVSSAQGIFLIENRQQYFKVVSASLGHRIRAINQDHHGHLIYGTYEGTFWHHPYSSNVHRLQPSPACTWSIHRLEDQGNLFIAEGDDIYKRLLFFKSTEAGIEVERVDSSLRVPNLMSYGMVMAKDIHRNGFWHTVGTEFDYDLAFYHTPTQRNYVLKPRFKNISAKAMLVRNGDIWAGGGGLYRIQNPDIESGTWSDGNFIIPPILQQQSINALYSDHKGNLWMGTNANGLFCYQPETGQYQQFTTNDGLPENSVFSILAEAGDSILWLGTGNGLSRFEVKRRLFTNFYTEDGLSNNEFNTGSMYKASDGTFYMGGQNGINYFNPNTVKRSLPTSQTFVMAKISTGPNAADKKYLIIRNGDKLEISATTQFIEFNFRTDDYLYADQVVFRYRSKRLFDDWQTLDFAEKALFTQLPSGTHVIELQSKNYRGSWSPSIHFTLVVLPHWYETWWFRLLIVLAIIGLSYGYYQMRLQQLRREFDLRQQISHDLHDSLGSRIYLLRSLSHQITNPLTGDSDKKAQLDRFEAISQDTFKSIRDFIWAFDPKHDEVNQLFNRMDDFAENYLSPLVSSIDIVRPQLNETIKIGPRLKHHLMNIYQEILTNIIKHTQAESINIQLGIDHKTIIIQIKNQHSGYKESLPDSRDSHKMGKDNLRHRLEEIGGTLEWAENEQNEQTILIRTPVTE